MKCGMVRELRERGILHFTDRMGREHERPPFQGTTPTCDEALVRHRRVPRGYERRTG